ncbi:MAG: oligosaccharide flippase family protein [Pseudomonadota bacterium]
MTFHRSLAWVFGQFVVMLAIELGGLAVLARLLTPVELGWYAAALAVLEFARFLGALELHTVIVRADRLDLAIRRQVVALALGASGVVALLLLLVTFPGWALLDEMPRELLLVMLPVLLLNCYAMTGHALLLREKRFDTLFFLKIAAAVVFLALAIPLALSGAGAQAMAVAMVGSSFAFALLSVIATRGAFWVRPSFRGGAETARLGGTVMAIAISHHATLAAVPLLVGRIAGYAALGQFSRADDFIRHGRRVLEDTVLPAIVPFVFDAARDAEVRVEELRPRLLVALSNLTAVTWPGIVVVIIVSPPLVDLLLGGQWGDVPALLQILAVGFLAHPINAVAYVYAIALRREAVLAWMSVAVLVATVALTIALAQIGLVEVAVGVAAVQIAHGVGRVAIAMRPLGISALAVLRALCASAGVTAMTALPVLEVSGWLMQAGQPSFVVLGAAGVVAAPAWFAGIVLLRHPLGVEIKRALATLRSTSPG